MVSTLISVSTIALDLDIIKKKYVKLQTVDPEINFDLLKNWE